MRKQLQFPAFILCLTLLISSCAERNPAIHAQTKTTEGTPASNSAETTNQKPESKEAKIELPEIISRKQWQAKESIGSGKEHTIRLITIHHTASLQNAKLSIEKKLQNLQNFSQSEGKLADGRTKPAWFDVPYHYYIAFDGKIGEGREIKYVGDTNTNYDPTGHATIVVEGNFEKELPTDEQIESIKKLTAWLADLYKIPFSDVKAHNDYASTACPGVNLKKLLVKFRDTIKVQNGRV